MSTHTVVLNSIEIDENIEEILSADISYAWNSGDSKFEGTITTQTLDVSGLIDEQSNIYTYWDIDGTRYLLNNRAIIGEAEGEGFCSFKDLVQSSIAITLNVSGELAVVGGTEIFSEVSGSALTGTEAITLLAVFVETSPT